MEMDPSQTLARAYKEARASGDTERATKYAEALKRLGGEAKGSFIDPVLQGASFGFSDEIEGGVIGGVNSLRNQTPFRDEYVKARDDARTRFNDFMDRNPVAGTALQFAGGTGAALKFAGSKAWQPAKTWYGKTAQGVGAGATGGAVAGAGYSEADTPMGVAGDSLAEGAIGAGLGAAFYPATKLLGMGADKVAEKLYQPRKASLRLLDRDLQRDGMTPERLQARLNALGPNAMIADAAGENVLDLADNVANQPSVARGSINSRLYNRDKGQYRRILDSAQSNLDVDDGYYDVMDALTNNRRLVAAPLYKKAYSKQVPVTDELRSILDTPLGKKAVNKAQEMAANRRMQAFNLKVNEAGELIEEPTMETWDLIKRAMDDVIYDDHADTFGRVKPTDSARYAADTRTALVDELDRLNPDYAPARNAYGSISESRRALEQGKLFLKEPSEFTTKKLQRLSDADKAFFRVGVMQAVRDEIEKTPYTSDVVKRLFNTPAKREKLMSVFPDMKSFRQFESSLLAESRMFRTKSRVTGGSPTQRRQAKDADVGSNATDFALDMFTGTPASATGNLARRALSGNRTMSDATAKELLDLMYSTDEAVKQAAIRELQSRRGRLNFKLPPPSAMGFGLLSATGD